jgi:hypothetical protein
MRHWAGIVGAAAILAATASAGSGARAADACTCHYKGENVPLGSRRCLQTPDGPRTAECVVETNVTSWRASSEPCPEASLVEPHV